MKNIQNVLYLIAIILALIVFIIGIMFLKMKGLNLLVVLPALIGFALISCLLAYRMPREKFALTLIILLGLMVLGFTGGSPFSLISNFAIAAGVSCGSILRISARKEI